MRYRQDVGKKHSENGGKGRLHCLIALRKMPVDLDFGVDFQSCVDIGFIFILRKGTNFYEESIKKCWGKESANESGSKFILCFDSSFVEFVQPCVCFSNSEEFIHVFMRIGFGSTIKLVSFDESQVVTFNGKFVSGFRNSDRGTGSGSDNTVGSPHGFIIHWIIISKNIKKVMEVIDVENWRIDNSRVLRVLFGNYHVAVTSVKGSPPTDVAADVAADTTMGPHATWHHLGGDTWHSNHWLQVRDELEVWRLVRLVWRPRVARPLVDRGNIMLSVRGS
nr:hypothetical protein [Tanacetum cinerariifolium]